MHVEWFLCCLACSYQAQIVLSAAFPGSLCVPLFWHQVLEANLIHFLALLEYSFVPATSAFICLWHAHELSHRQRKKLGKREVGRQARVLGFPAVEWNQVLQRAWFLHQDPPAELAANHSMTSLLLAVPFLPYSSSLPGNRQFISIYFLFTVPRINGHPKLDRHREHPPGYDSSSTMMSSELESSSFIDSDDDDNTSR